MAKPFPVPPCDQGAHAFMVALVEEFLTDAISRPDDFVDVSQTSIMEYS